MSHCQKTYTKYSFRSCGINFDGDFSSNFISFVNSKFEENIGAIAFPNPSSLQFLNMIIPFVKMIQVFEDLIRILANV